MPAEAQGSLYATRRGYGIRWLEHGQRRYRSGFETKREARQWFEDEIRPRLRGRRRASSTMTLSEFGASWLAAHAADVEPSTITSLRCRLAQSPASWAREMRRSSASPLRRAYGRVSGSRWSGETSTALRASCSSSVSTSRA